MLRDHHRGILRLMMSWEALLMGTSFIGLLSIPSISGTDSPTATLPASVLMVTGIGILAWPIVLQGMGLYESMRTMEFSRVLSRLMIAAILVTTMVAAAAFTFSAPIASSFPFIVGTVQFALLALTRGLVLTPLRAARRIGRNFRNVLIVGSGPRAAYVKRSIDSRPDWGLRVIGFVDVYDSPVDPSLHNAKFFKLDAMPDLLREQVVDRVIIAYPRTMLSMLSPVVAVCAKAGIPFTMLADLFGDLLPPPRVTQFGTLAALEFAPVHHDPMLLFVKRVIDAVGACVALVAAAPILAMAAIAIRLDDGGPIFFKQVRCGLNGRPFTMIKLRTMCAGADEQKDGLSDLNECDGPVFKCRNDPRITRTGRWLRKYSIDEIPQLINVVKGDMSLVGPRPAVPNEVVQYQTFERRRLSMRPGITCLWQVSGRSNIGFDRWVQLDVQYIDSWSLGLDFLVLLRTIPAVVRGEGAH